MTGTNQRNTKNFSELPQKAYGIVLAAEFVLFSFLLFFKVTEIPVPFNVDEAGMAYDAVSLAKYHCDRYLYRFPVYFVNFGGGQNALYTYLTAVLVRIFGYSILIVRLPAILLSMLSAFILTMQVRKEHGRTASALMGGFFCILPFSLMHSRWGLESYLLFPMLIFSVTAFYQSLQRRKNILFLISGVLFGITLYAYTVSYLLLPVFLCVILLYLLLIHKINWKNLLCLVTPLIFSAVPLILMLAVNNGIIGEIRTRFFSVPQFPFYRAGEISFRHIIDNLKFGSHNIFYNLFVYDFCKYNIIPKFGSIYYIGIPFIIFGFLICLRRGWLDLKNRTFSFDLLILLLFFSSFGISLMYEGINANRACAVYIPLIYFLVIGTFETLKKWKPAVFLLFAVYPIFFGFFIKYYFTEFPKIIEGDSMFASVVDIGEAVDFADTVNIHDGTIYVLDSVQPYIFVLLSRQIDPFTFNEQKIMSSDHFVKVLDKYRFRLDAVSPDCIYIYNSADRVPEDLINSGFETKQFGTVTVYYQPAD